MEKTAPDTAEAIIAAIRRAFDNVTRGDGISLREADAIDSYAGEDQRKQARALDTDKHWREIPPEDLERFHVALTFMDAEGFRYYLPAFMTRALEARETGSLAMDAVLGALFALSDTAADKFLLLDTPQKRAIAGFLWFVATETNGQWKDKLDVYNATRALEDTWYPYLKSEAAT
jgi:hypothetical protein